jgi:hypothetical protein
LHAFIIIAFLLIVLFPTLGYTKSVYRPNEDSPSILPDESFPPDSTAAHHNILYKLQHAGDNILHRDHSATARTIDAPPRVSVWSVIWSTLQVIWRGIVIVGQFTKAVILRPLQILTFFLLDKVLFLLHPFIIMGMGLYTFAIVWPLRIVTYLATLFYPIYVFLACASVVGLIIGGVGSLVSNVLNDYIFPPNRPSQRKSISPPLSRPKTADSLTNSQISSGEVTPAAFQQIHPLRAPPPSKYPSGLTGLDPVHILDTNVLFSSFSLPVPPATPPNILYSAPTPAASVSGGAGGVVGETIFEEEDDSDEKTPVATDRQQESWGFGAGRPLTRPESAHGRLVGREDGGGTITWHAKVKREDADARGIDWGEEDGVRKWKRGVAGT